MRFREQEVLTGHKFADVLGMKLRLRALGSSPQFFSFFFLKPPALAALLLALSNIFSQLSFSFFPFRPATKKRLFTLPEALQLWLVLSHTFHFPFPPGSLGLWMWMCPPLVVLWRVCRLLNTINTQFSRMFCLGFCPNYSWETLLRNPQLFAQSSSVRNFPV